MGETITNEVAAARRQATSAGTGLSPLTLPENVGYLAISSFAPASSAAALLDAAFAALAETRGIIIDLRGNGGGDAATASLLSSMLFDTEAAYRAEVYRPWASRDEPATAVCTVRYHGPVIVLLGRRSSAIAWRFARNLVAMGRVVLAGELPAVAHGTAGAEVHVPVPESQALRRAHERLATG